MSRSYAVVGVIAAVMAFSTVASSQQTTIPPIAREIPEGLADRVSPALLGATMTARAGIQGAACRTGSPPSTLIGVEADVSIPADSAPTSARYEVVIDGATVARGTTRFGRVRRPDGSYVSPNSTTRINATVTRLVWNETKTVTVRLPDQRLSATANYAIECLRAVERTVTPSGTLALPDLAFESLLSISLYRQPASTGESEEYTLRRFDGEILLWDTRLCRGHNSAWVIANIEPGLVNRGALDVTQPVVMAFTVERAPGSIFDSAPASPRSVYQPHELRFIEQSVSAARAAAGTGEAALDHVARYTLPASYFPRGAARGRDADTGRESSFVSQYNNADVALPCGGPRRLTIILDPDNAIRESDETNNTMTVTYRLIG